VKTLGSDEQLIRWVESDDLQALEGLQERSLRKTRYEGAR